MATKKAKPASTPKKRAAKKPAAKKRPARQARAPAKPAKRPPAKKAKVVLLAGGNPQIAKGDGAAPVKAFLAAMPADKRAIGKRIDAIVTRSVPNVQKAVRWNSPFYGREGHGYFLSFHVFTHYVRVTFFAGLSLKPVPPGGTPKSKDTRWVDVRAGELDEKELTAWVKQAAKLEGFTP